MSKALDKHLKKTIGQGRCPSCGGLWHYIEYKKLTGRDPDKIHDCECNGSFP